MLIPVRPQADLRPAADYARKRTIARRTQQQGGCGVLGLCRSNRAAPDRSQPAATSREQPATRPWHTPIDTTADQHDRRSRAGRPPPLGGGRPPSAARQRRSRQRSPRQRSRSRFRWPAVRPGRRSVPCARGCSRPGGDAAARRPAKRRGCGPGRVLRAVQGPARAQGPQQGAALPARVRDQRVPLGTAGPQARIPAQGAA